MAIEAYLHSGSKCKPHPGHVATLGPEVRLAASGANSRQPEGDTKLSLGCSLRNPEQQAPRTRQRGTTTTNQTIGSCPSPIFKVRQRAQETRKPVAATLKTEA